MSIRYESSLTLLAAVLTSATLVSSTAVAAVQREPVVVTGPRDADRISKLVSFRDLSLTAAGDQLRLHRRVKAAVEDVCGLHDGEAARSLWARSLYVTCSDGAWDGARPQITAAIDRAAARLAAGGSDVASGAIVVSARAGN